MDDATGELDRTVALVTGASSGIGAATAKTLAAAGASVALAARRADRLETLATAIEDNGGTALAIPTDVTDGTAVEEMIERTTEAFGGLDALVNNAGVMLPAPVERADPDDWRRMVEVNLLGTMNVTRAVLPALRAGDGGHVVALSSDAIQSPSARFGAYAATKAGVVAFADSLRAEVADDGVRVTVVEPGVTDTELPDQVTDEGTKADVETLVASMRALDGEDVAAAVRYALTRPAHVSVDRLTVRPTDAG
ncbi:oxidoreductase (short-chain dehydrogenase family) protein [Halococcus morrhuae DSM 1307]|uniref:Oxidoreductase (Short-chain dehydrogenase family) protein n=1 Tax=Halococcus morrhuae DSM 1307 TaxID=931277 RepID=M0MRY1_HALMO|nr:SDR family oxidoreductase [Halococcus morrhuae]EMA48113.1 oxidoreductase (short-chain dehydrogenase family) protein [Halococcus morrhuae DSM 1307]